MKRRELIQGALGLLAFGAAGTSMGARPCPATLSGTSPVVCPRPPGGVGPMSDLAATMSSGTWARLSTTSGLQSLLDSYYPASGNGSRSFLEYNTNAYVYNDEIHFTGAGHESPTHHLKYSEANGTWSFVSSAGIHGHTYDGFSIDQATGNFYLLYGNSLYKGNSGGNWGFHSTRSGGEIVDGGVWFPEANGGAGGYVIYTVKTGTGVLHLSSPDASSWSVIDSSASSGTGDNYHNSCIHLPNQGVVMFGGGNGAQHFVELDANQNVTTKADLPAHWGPGFEGSNGSMVAFENGRVFHIGLGNQQLSEYSHAANAWSGRGSLAGGIGDFWQVSCAIDSLGVILVLSQASSSISPIEEWIYKL